MKILWVKANKILPVHSGGDLRSFNILCQLASHEQVTFFSYYDGDEDAEYERNLQEQLPEAVCVNVPRSASTLSRGFDYLLRTADAAPYAVSRFASKKVRYRLKRCIDQLGPEILVCDFLDAAINFPHEIGAVSILFQHNVESEIWRRHAETARSFAKKQFYKREFVKMMRYERSTIRKFSRVIAVSENDRSLMSAWVDGSRIDVIPTGVDLARFRGDGKSSASDPLVVFVGAMDWEPNVDAVEYFCSNIWPKIRDKVPDARFRIVGRNPQRRVRNLASSVVEVTGSVPSVIEHLREAAAVVVPLRIGGGTRLKIYEAMASGKAVVSTSVGAEGLDVHHGKDIWLADETDSFADAVIRLLQDQEVRHNLERGAAAQAKKFDWSSVGERFRQILCDTLYSRVESETADFVSRTGTLRA